MESDGIAAAIGLILTKGGSTGSAQMSCRFFPNHRLILSLILNIRHDYPNKAIQTYQPKAWAPRSGTGAACSFRVSRTRSGDF
jgi:hypothetical protein